MAESGSDSLRMREGFSAGRRNSHSAVVLERVKLKLMSWWELGPVMHIAQPARRHQGRRQQGRDKKQLATAATASRASEQPPWSIMRDTYHIFLSVTEYSLMHQTIKASKTDAISNKLWLVWATRPSKQVEWLVGGSLIYWADVSLIKVKDQWKRL